MELLDPIDALMLTAELVSSPMHVAAVLILTPPEGSHGEVGELFEASLRATDRIDPRLRRRPYRGLDTGMLWVWRDADDIDIRHHMQRRTLPPGAGPEALWRMVSELHALRLDHSAPLWMAYLIDGLPDGRFAFYIKVHHIVVDGVAGLQMIARSLTTDPGERGMPPFYACPPPQSAPPAERHPPALLAALRAIGSAAGSGLDLTRSVLAAESATILGSIVSRAVVAPFSAPHTPFNTRLGPRRAVAATDVDQARVRAIQQAAGVTGNDVVTTVIAGAVRAWLAGRGELPDRSLVAICPVSVRDRGDVDADGHGNRFGLGLCPLGTDIADPAERLALVHEAMANVKRQVSTRGPGAMLVVLAPAIGPTVLLPLLPLGSAVPPSYNMPISNVRGPQRRMYFNGSRVDEIYPVSTIYDGMALNATVCSYAGRIGVGYVADPDVVPDLDALAEGTERSLAELERAVDRTQ